MDLPETSETPTLKILLIEDDIIDAELVQIFSKSFVHFQPEVTHVVDVDSAIKAIDEQSFDIVMLDFWLEGQNSLKFLFDLERRKLHLPMIIRSNITKSQVETLRLTDHGALFLSKAKCSAQILETAVEEAIALVRASNENHPPAKVA